MSYSGSMLLLKIFQDDQFMTIGGLKTTSFQLASQMIDASSKTSGKWRSLLDEAGKASVSISGTGIFTNSASEQLVKGLAFNGKQALYRLCFASGEILEGQFQIVNYERSGNFSAEETYSIDLESSGEVRFL